MRRLCPELSTVDSRVHRAQGQHIEDPAETADTPCETDPHDSGPKAPTPSLEKKLFIFVRRRLRAAMPLTRRSPRSSPALTSSRTASFATTTAPSWPAWLPAFFRAHHPRRSPLPASVCCRGSPRSAASASPAHLCLWRRQGWLPRVGAAHRRCRIVARTRVDWRCCVRRNAGWRLREQLPWSAEKRSRLEPLVRPSTRISGLARQRPSVW